MPNKECSRCKTVKDHSAFTKASDQPDGKGRWCKTCVAEQRLERLASRPKEHRKAQEVTCACCEAQFTRQDGRSIYCSVRCKRKGSPARQEKMLQDARDKHEASRQWLHTYKLERGCYDCGYNSHAEALQFDHEGDKTASISQLRWSIPKMLEEIKRGQCVVRCANCHAIKTRQRLLAKAIVKTLSS